METQDILAAARIYRAIVYPRITENTTNSQLNPPVALCAFLEIHISSNLFSGFKRSPWRGYVYPRIYMYVLGHICTS